MAERIPTHRIILAVALRRREDCHAVLDEYLGTLPDGRPVVRLDVPLEKVGAPGVVAAWGSSTGARASVYGPVLRPMIEAMIPGEDAVDYETIISHVRWPSAADQAAQSRAVGYVITAARDPETGAWTQYRTRAQVLADFRLARLSGTPEEQTLAIAAAEAIEAAAGAGP